MIEYSKKRKGTIKMLEPKRTLLLRLYQILNEYSDYNHPLKQQDIIDILNKEYGIEIERKAIGRNISYLKEMGLEIESDRRGSYLTEKQFDTAEIRLLIDCVLSSRHISAKYSKDLIDKLVKLGGIYFKSHVKHIHSINDWGKSDVKFLFLNVDMIDEAIEKGRQISFDYNKYGIDKKLHVVKNHIVNPYQMIIHKQNYYLMANDVRWKDVGFYHLDRITNIQILDTPIKPITEIKGYERGINYKELANSRPYMFSDKIVNIKFKCKKRLIDALIDWFGFDFEVKEIDDENIQVSLNASKYAMIYWGLQFGDCITILEPQDLIEDVKEIARQILDNHK